MERINKFYVIVGLAVAALLFFGVIANADELDDATTVTFSAAVEIPGQVLPAGTYLFKLADTSSDPNMVEIFNADGTKLYGTFQTIATVRQHSTDDTSITLVEQETGKPDALLNWFYPGRLTGNEFLYSSDQEKELAQGMQHTIQAGSQPGMQTGE